MEANCVCLDVQYLMFTLIILTKWRVLFFICFFFPRERVSHHSRIGLHRGLNRTKFMACGNHRTVKKCKSTKYKCLGFFFKIKQNHRKPTFSIRCCGEKIPIRCPSVAENQSKVLL